MKIALNVKNMKETYMNARADMENVWKTFYTMSCMNFISHDEWVKFFNTCYSWEYDRENDRVIDFYEEKIIKQF